MSLMPVSVFCTFLPLNLHDIFFSFEESGCLLTISAPPLKPIRHGVVAVITCRWARVTCCEWQNATVHYIAGKWSLFLTWFFCSLLLWPIAVLRLLLLAIWSYGTMAVNDIVSLMKNLKFNLTSKHLNYCCFTSFFSIPQERKKKK